MAEEAVSSNESVPANESVPVDESAGIGGGAGGEPGRLGHSDGVSTPEAAADSADKPAEPVGPSAIDVDGEDVPIELLKEAYQNARTIKEREELVEEYVEGWKTHPADQLLATFTNFNGGDQKKGYEEVIKFCDRILNFHMSRENLPENERQILEREEALAARQREIEEKERLANETAAERAEAEELENVTRDIKSAIKAGGLPDTPATVQKIARVLLDARAAGLKSMTYEQAAKKVKANIERDKKEAVSYIKPADMSPEQLEEVRQYLLKTAKDGKAGPKTPKAEGSGNVIKLPTRVMNPF